MTSDFVNFLSWFKHRSEEMKPLLQPDQNRICCKFSICPSAIILVLLEMPEVSIHKTPILNLITVAIYLNTKIVNYHPLILKAWLCLSRFYKKDTHFGFCSLSHYLRTDYTYHYQLAPFVSLCIHNQSMHPLSLML